MARKGYLASIPQLPFEMMILSSSERAFQFGFESPVDKSGRHRSSPFYPFFSCETKESWTSGLLSQLGWFALLALKAAIETDPTHGQKKKKTQLIPFPNGLS
ncbi:putative aspartyl-tRNA synthetase protein [Corchorus olitorius]|uniref:Aspartyl-tRNA synthetase protein n=1 Tax=Corchorus olitorius TaxID=93759 RepID=A0A1R3J1A1_9ROSI|nr:putative aspartyl-tRNA synthetase protein [Corchorus olitorius]